MVHHNFFLDLEIIKRRMVMISDFLGLIDDHAGPFLFFEELIPNIKFSTFAEGAVCLAVLYLPPF